MHLLEIGQCICLTAITESIDGILGQSQQNIESIDFEQGIDLSNFSVGEVITIGFFDRNTNMDTCLQFTINSIDANTIFIDVSEGGLQDFLNEGDGVQVFTNEVKWEFEICEVPADASTFVYSAVNKSWIGKYDYAFDRYLAIKNRTFGMRDLSTFELNKGFEINGSDIIASVTQVSAKDQMDGKEFIRFRSASDNKPTRVEFLDAPEGAVLAALDPAIQGPLYLKDYRGFEQYIPRKQDAQRQRIQDRLLIFKVIHDKPEHFKIVNTMIKYKIIK